MLPEAANPALPERPWPSGACYALIALGWARQGTTRARHTRIHEILFHRGSDYGHLVRGHVLLAPLKELALFRADMLRQGFAKGLHAGRVESLHLRAGEEATQGAVFGEQVF